MEEQQQQQQDNNDTSRILNSPPAPPQPSILEEADETIAQSLMIFLFADLRLLSATGRIYTKFEWLCIDSDFCDKTSAEQLANPFCNEDHGISHGQIMAALMLEVRKEIEEHKATLKEHKAITSRYFKGDGIQEGLKEEFIFLRDRHVNKFEENMHSLLKAYNDMIRQDRNKDFKGISAHGSRRVQVGSFVEVPTDVEQQDSGATSTSASGGGLVLDTSQDSAAAFPGIKLATSSIPEGEEEDDSQSSGNVEMVFMQSARRALLEKKRSYMERSKARQEAWRKMVEKQRLALVEGQEAVDRTEFEDLGIWALDENQTTESLSPEQVIQLMETAVVSRQLHQLDFLADFFRPNTQSWLMVKSKARVVWMNDWYPIKDLIYALSVDTEKKRVLVVFRGAITQADWHHAYDAEQIKVPNPVKDAGNKKDTMKVYSGFYRYLFRRRKDTDSTKYDEIANMVHAYGISRIGSDYHVATVGFSLGAALSTLFGLYASTEERFTKNGPVKLFTFGSPMVGGHAFCKSFRYQETMGKLQYARFFNVRDVVSHLPINLLPSKRGSRYQHVGLGVKIHRKYWWKFWQSQATLPATFYYSGGKNVVRSYGHALRTNALFNCPWPWKIKSIHSLEEHVRRLNLAKKAVSSQPDHAVNKTLDELYRDMVLPPKPTKQEKNDKKKKTTKMEEKDEKKTAVQPKIAPSSSDEKNASNSTTRNKETEMSNDETKLGKPKSDSTLTTSNHTPKAKEETSDTMTTTTTNTSKKERASFWRNRKTSTSS